MPSYVPGCENQYVDHLQDHFTILVFFGAITQLLLPIKEESANCLIRLLLILK
jgi:hypothetical protein